MDPSNPLAPIFATSVAVQQILEVLSAFVEEWVGESRKKAVLGIIGFLIGMLVAYQFDLHVMEYFKVARAGGFLDTVVTALILSAGTEGTNSIVKFLKYLKEDKKATAAETLQMLRKRSGEVTSSPVSSGAKRTLEKLRTRAGRTAALPPSTAAAAEDDAAKIAAFTYISGR